MHFIVSMYIYKKIMMRVLWEKGIVNGKSAGPGMRRLTVTSFTYFLGNLISSSIKIIIPFLTLPVFVEIK